MVSIPHTLPGEFADPVTDCAGNLNSREAWEMLKSDPRAQLVDVRTQPEWVFVGVPDLSSLGKKALFVSWKRYPNFDVNPHFAAQLEKEGATPDAPLLFMCRSGGRSLDAARAMTAKGYAKCYNVSDGFEGEPDARGHRGVQSGWKAARLPWGQT